MIFGNLSGVKRWVASSLLGALLLGSAPASAQVPGYLPPGSVEEGCWKVRAELTAPGAAPRNLLISLASRAREAKTPYEQAFLAWTLALGAQRLQRTDPTTAKQLETASEQSLSGIAGWIATFNQMQPVHGDREPVWIHSQPEAVAQALLAWTTLQKSHPTPVRMDLIQKFAQGLVLLHHPDCQCYPFRAHTSFAPGRPDCPGYAPLLERVAGAGAVAEDGADSNGAPVPNPPTLQEIGKAPGALWIPERSRQVEALVACSSALGDKTMLDEAQQEGLGMWTHLVVSDKLPLYFAPAPEGMANLRAASVVADQLAALFKETGNPVYSTLLGVAARWESALTAHNESEKDALRCLHSSADACAYKFRQASDLYPPVSYQIMQAEDGKAVQKAFDLIPVTYPDGEAGKMARVGRENMFWMRFDVDREQDYFFYLIFLKSKLEGGLISVMMRIDGDKIFKVPLGGASDAFVDMDFVDGPRPLRQGPHSFGIRFSGLLMTQPALLDCVVAWAVVERRCFKLEGNKRLMILHNSSPLPARATCKELGSATPTMTAVDGSGNPAQVGREIDKRRRREYLIVPAGGTAVLEWNEVNSSSAAPP